jgi:hypothetical protein
MDVMLRSDQRGVAFERGFGGTGGPIRMARSGARGGFGGGGANA